MRAFLSLLLTLFFLHTAVLPAGAKKKDPRAHVRLETSAGDIVVALSNETPAHRDNFLKLVREGYYDGLLFHRVIRNFMIQSGDPDSRGAQPGQKLGEGGPAYTLPQEICWPALFHHRGALAAAREGDDVNPERRSSGSQFYIVWGTSLVPRTLAQVQERISSATGGEIELTDEQKSVYQTQGGSPHLDGQYTVFGEVIEGLKTVKEIQKTKTDANDRPLEDVVLRKATVIKEFTAP